MQYAPDQDSMMPDAPKLRPRVRRAVLDELDKPDGGIGTGRDLMGPAGPASGNTGIAGGMPAPSPVAAPAPMPAAQSPGTARDVLQNAMRSNLSTIQSAQGDTARKAAAESVIRGVLPQLQQMGVNVGDIRNEKIQIDGRWIDLLRDVEGAADLQWLDESETPQAVSGAGGQGNIMRGMDPAASSLIDQIRQNILALMGNQ